VFVVEGALLVTAAAATTGVQVTGYHPGFSGAAIGRHLIEHWTSTTTKAVTTGSITSSTNNVLASIASAGSTAYPSFYSAWSAGTPGGAGTFTLGVRSEVNGSQVCIKAGSRVAFYQQ
jgi:hypothetical protein